MAYLSQFLHGANNDVKANYTSDQLNDLLRRYNALQDPQGLEAASLNASYSSDDRAGSSNTKAQSVNLDTSEYDAKIKELESVFGGQVPNYILTHVGKTNLVGNSKINEYGDALTKLLSIKTNRNNYINDQANRVGLDAATTQASQALNSQQQSDAQTAQSNTSSNMTAGINKSAAGLLGSQSASTDTSVAQGAYTANRANAASTQADYLKKMSQADQLDAEAQASRNGASNASSGALLSALSGAFTGAASGAVMGGMMSDERGKEAPEFDQRKLMDAVKQFKELKARVDELRGNK